MSYDYLKTMTILKATLRRNLEKLQSATECALKCSIDAPEYEEFVFEEAKYDYVCSVLESVISRIEEQVENEGFDFNT